MEYIFLILTIIVILILVFINLKLKKKIENLENEKNDVLKANNGKTDFLIQVSHDIRTPLNAIVGFASSLEKVTSIDKVREYSNDILSASNEILDKVNGILNISKIEENKMIVENNNYSFIKECDEIIKFVKPRIDNKNIMFKYLLSREIPKTLYGDKNIIREIIINLLNNAIEYTKNGYIDLKVFCKNKDDISSLIIIVEDSGAGISDDNVDKIFEKYSKFDEESNDVCSGLELSLTKKLVKLLGGRIVVKTASSAGTKIVIYLEQKIGNDQNELLIEKAVDTIDNKLELTGKKILIVDDNYLNLKVAVNFIKPYGADVTTCVSGSECISLINNGNVYDLIFMDYMMPNLSGAETLNVLKKNPNFKQRVVVLTANNIDGFREKYIEEGFEDYISKPILKEELERILRKFLNNDVQKVIYDKEDDLI